MKTLFYRPSWVEIDLAAISHNLRQIRKLCQPHVKILALVKADAYGHGMVEVSRQMVKDGVNFLGVASIDEAIVLRRNKIKIPILVLAPIFDQDLGAILKYDLTITLCCVSSAQRFNTLAKRLGKTVKAHVKIDTGMGRLGIWHLDALQEVREFQRLKNIDLEGLYTHLSSADVDRDFTFEQIKIFEELIDDLKSAGVNFKYYHAANSIGTVDFKDSHFNLIRPGLIVYGLSPKSGGMKKIKLKPVMSLHSKVIFVKDVEPGRSISYGRTYITKSHSRIVTIPIGYGDGYSRVLSNRAPVLIKGKLLRIAGRVCMDQIMVDAGNHNVAVGDEVVLLGRQGSRSISAEELAQLANTIPYEIACSIGQQRLPRIFLK